MILADENLPESIFQTLRGKGIDVYSVKENNPGISDQEVIELSKSDARIILTEDKDFGEWVFAHNEIEISVILLRYRYSDKPKITTLLVDLIEKRGMGLIGNFITITVDKIRIRKIV